MGATTFMTRAAGATAQEAFRKAVEKACWQHGHGGYTGTIAEKTDFVMIDCPDNVLPHDYADQLIDDGDERIDDKWGPAGCIALGDNRYLFFGWASE